MPATFLIPALALLLLGHGVGKLSRAPVVVAPLRESGFPEDYYLPFGLFDLALSIGLFVGLVVPPVGQFSLLVLIPYCLLAFGFHVRSSNTQAVPMVVFGALAGYALYASLNAAPVPDRPDEYVDLDQLSRSAT